jgi:uncharacterized protein YgiM (DUF1202 family)
MTRKISLCLLGALFALLAACQPEPERINELPTATLLPIVSQTPRLTATPVPSRTPLPTFTFTPTETVDPPTATLSPTPTATATIVGIVQSMQRVNVREGPGVDYDSFTSLAAGAGVQIMGRDAAGEWLNIRMEDGTEGWIASRLIFIPETATPFPTLTPSPDLTALFLGTPLPTAFLGGGTITPTPPGSIATATPIGFEATDDVTEEVGAVPTTGTGSGVAFLPQVPVVDLPSLQLTATVLVRGAATETATITPTLIPTAEREITLPPTSATGATTPDANTTVAVGDNATVDASVNQGLTADQVRELAGIDVFAYCNRTAFGLPAPTGLKAGQSIDIYWAWFAREEAQVLQHVANVTIDLKVNGQPVTNVNQYRTRVFKQGADYTTYWYVPFGPLEAGDYEITFTQQWKTAITDGYESFGPGTAKPFEQESCKFTVR